MPDEFKLPGSSYQEVSKIIQGYATLGKASSLADVSKTTGGMDPTNVSRNTGFLVSVGILEAGKNKAPTSLGISLGNALMHEQAEEVKRLFAEVVAENDFLKGIVSAIRIRKGMDDSALRSHIAYSAGAKKGSAATVGSGAVIEILHTAGAIAPEDGKYVVVSGSASPKATNAENTTSESVYEQRGQASVAGKSTVVVAPSKVATLSSGNGGIAININIEVSCDVGDLDSLGQKLRQIMDDVNAKGEDLSADGAADRKDPTS
ncbi:MAG: hypothetical protein JJ902_09215 [Roseibium sp.]|nr:hypothetical protein [Roseibium sp.]